MIVPERIKRLPLDENGSPILYFMKYVTKEPDARSTDAKKFERLWKQDLCWICGDRLGQYRAFVITAGNALTRTTTEPPNHKECATWAAQHRPFLASPDCAGVWITKGYTVFKWHRPPFPMLITMGNPEHVEWWIDGRAATREEIIESVKRGMPPLQDLANTEPSANGRMRGHISLLDQHDFIMANLLPQESPV